MTGSGVQGTGRWVPEFPGQRPPFEHGNLASVRHGAFSKRFTGPRAVEIVADLLGSPGCPEYLRDDVAYADAIQAWAEARAEVERLRAYRDWIEEQLSAEDSVSNYLTETTAVTESEVRPALGQIQRDSLTRQSESLGRALHRSEMKLRSMRNDLGLSPAGRSKLGKDAISPRFDLSTYWAVVDEEEQAEEAGDLERAERARVMADAQLRSAGLGTAAR